MSDKFDPTKLGFELYSPQLGNRHSLRDKDYLIFSHTKRGYKKLNFSFSPETSEFIHELLGDKVNLYLNDEGHILISSGDSMKVSRPKKKHGEERCMVSCSGMADKFIEKYGEFRRLYFDKELYGNENALIFKPNGERDNLS